MSEMTISPLTQNDLNFLDVAQDMAFEIVYKYAPDLKGDLTPEILEKVFSGWLDNPGNYEANVIVNSLGTAFGNYMVDTLGLKWGRIRDQYGEALAVYKEAPKSWTTFPFDVVQKRVHSKERQFFVALYDLAKMHTS